MSLEPVVCYYSPAKPESGYTRAVRGYAEKLAAALEYDVQAISPQTLPEKVPKISIGLKDAAWTGLRPQFELKARPYDDQHGLGPSMHPLRLVDLEQSRRDWELLHPVGLVCIANPHWLAAEPDHWVQAIDRWAACNHLSSLIITNSPRTNPLMWQALQAAMTQHLSRPFRINNAHGSDNAYLTALAAADAVCLLGTSRSMAGEAALSGAPIAVASDEDGGSDRLIKAATELMGDEAARYQIFQSDIPLQRGPFARIDITKFYLANTVAQIRNGRAA